MIRATASDALLEQLAFEKKRVLSDWRALILLRRATFARPPAERRWSSLPEAASDIHPVLRSMRNRQDLTEIPGHRHLYEVTTPYARQYALDQREILMELHPYATFSHITALEFHGLTIDLAKALVATSSSDPIGSVQPIGTTIDDWEDLAPPRISRPAEILGMSITWKRIAPARFFGFAEYRQLGYPLRFTTLERTLIDAIQAPELCGGVERVLQAWGEARDRLHLDTLISHVEQLDIAILRQRTGYILQALGINHPAFADWKANAKRGSSSRLVSASPFSSHFDADWSLSLNAPVDILQEYLL